MYERLGQHYRRSCVPKLPKYVKTSVFNILVYDYIIQNAERGIFLRLELLQLIDMRFPFHSIGPPFLYKIPQVMTSELFRLQYRLY